VATRARIGDAKVAFLLRFVLAANFGVEGAALSDLFTGPARIWQFGPTVTVPVFIAGRNRDRLGAAEMRQNQTLQYPQTVQYVFRAVEDGLVAHRKNREVRTEQEALVGSAEQTFGLAERRYLIGIASHLGTLAAQR
jgi:multidrug efflux system outer membrane protein